VLLTACDSIYACGYEIGEVAIPGNDRDDVANNFRKYHCRSHEERLKEIKGRVRM
jgi:hypothetical protein